MYRDGRRAASAALPPEAGVPGVVFAAQQELERRGYIIESTEATTDRGLAIARTPDARLKERVTVGAERLADGTRVTVRVEPHGHRVLAGDILDGLLVRLGL